MINTIFSRLNITFTRALCVTVLLFLVIISSSFNSLEKNAMNQISFYTEPQKVHSLEIFPTVEFAGDTIPFYRYDVRERFDRELLAFTYMHSTTFLLVKRSNLYFPIIEPILKENGVPDDFKYLALIESYFNPLAVSPAKAAGIWQFLASTAKMYGLEVNSQVDERFNVEKSTVAACKYMKEAYQLYGDWAMAAASYNAGRARISTELQKQNSKSFFDLYLNDETTRYVYRIIAAKEVISNPCKYGFSLSKEDFYHTVRTKNIEVNTSVENWAKWAEDHGSFYAQLRYYNPWIRDMRLDNTERKTYIVKIPYQEDVNFDINKVIIHSENWLEKK